MKKKYIPLYVGILLLCFSLSSCGKKKDQEETASIDQTVDTTADASSGDVVTMQQDKGIDKSKITKYLGTKSTDSAEVVITNRTGREISEFYMRPTPTNSEDSEEDYDGDSWGADLIQENFTLKDQEQALLYYNKNNTNSTGSKVVKYDFQIAYKDMEPSMNCFFRELDLSITEEYILRLDDSGIPYAQYTNTVTKKQDSTLSAAKARMGIEDSEEDGDSDSTSSETTPTPTQAPNASTEPTPAPTDEPDIAPPDEPEDPSSAASEYVGKTLDQMISDGRVGSPPSMEYDEDESTGRRIGYYYYDGFTVYTTQNDDGSETVTAVYSN